MRYALSVIFWSFTEPTRIENPNPSPAPIGFDVWTTRFETQHGEDPGPKIRSLIVAEYDRRMAECGYILEHRGQGTKLKFKCLPVSHIVVPIPKRR